MKITDLSIADCCRLSERLAKILSYKGINPDHLNKDQYVKFFDLSAFEFSAGDTRKQADEIYEKYRVEILWRYRDGLLATARAMLDECIEKHSFLKQGFFLTGTAAGALIEEAREIDSKIKDLTKKED